MADEQPPTPTDQDNSMIGAGIGIGVAIGTAIGVAMNNIAFGIPIGVALGLALGIAFNQNKKRPNDRSQSEATDYIRPTRRDA